MTIGDHGGAYGDFLVEQRCYNEAPREPHGLQEGLMPAFRPPFSFFGLGDPEVKFDQITLYFGDHKLHAPAWFFDGFGSVSAGLRADYDQIMESLKIKNR